MRHAIEFIKRKDNGSRILGQARDEVRLAIDATPRYKLHDRQKIVAQNKKNPVRHAYFREYLALQRLCLLILEDQEHQIGSGENQIYGILVDGAWLWEEYVNTLIGGKKGKFHHPSNKTGKGKQHLFNGKVGKIYPDFISKSSKQRIIADVKYKPNDNISGRDYLQLLAYMFRFEAKTGFYLYPEKGDSKDQALRLNRGTTYENDVAPREGDDVVTVIKRGLNIPADASNYEGFVEQMKKSENEFKEFALHQ